MSEVGSVWWGHGFLIAACAIGSLPLLLLIPGIPRDLERRRWASRTTMLALVLLLASMGSFRIHNSDQSHLEAADILFATTLLTGLLVGATARSRWSIVGVLGFGVTCAIAFPTSLFATHSVMNLHHGSGGPGALSNFPVAWIIGLGFPVYGGLAAAGMLLALRDGLRSWRKREPAR